MGIDLSDLRSLVYGDDELHFICAECLTVLAHGEVPVDTLEFNTVDVTINRNERTLTFQDVLSTDSAPLQVTEAQFVELAKTVAQPWSGDELAEWEERRKRRVWPMPPRTR